MQLKVVINKPAAEVFAFTTDPKNTPRWIDSIVVEETNEWPVKLGSIYRNQNRHGEWAEYKVTQFEPNKSFIFSKKGSAYHVRYTFTPVSDNQTELEYYEWVDRGELEPFTQEALDKLKHVMEAK